MPNKLLFSVTSKDFDTQTFRCPGAGGGGKDTSSSGVRLIHRASGAVGEGRETRSFAQNRKAAFRRLIDSPVFKNWHRAEIAKHIGQKPDETPEEIMVRVDLAIEEGLRTGTILVEELKDGIFITTT